MKSLKKIYNYWIKFGDIIGKITSKIIIFIIFFLLFTPISILLKLLKKDLLDKKILKSKKSYWVKRDNKPNSMKYQF